MTLDINCSIKLVFKVNIGNHEVFSEQIMFTINFLKSEIRYIYLINECLQNIQNKNKDK